MPTKDEINAEVAREMDKYSEALEGAIDRNCPRLQAAHKSGELDKIAKVTKDITDVAMSSISEETRQYLAGLSAADRKTYLDSFAAGLAQTLPAADKALKSCYKGRTI